LLDPHQVEWQEALIMSKEMIGVMGCVIIGLSVAAASVNATSINSSVGKVLGGVADTVGKGVGGVTNTLGDTLSSAGGGIGDTVGSITKGGAPTSVGPSLAIVGAVGDTGTGGFTSMISGLLSGY
jgi:hypothetical protein